MNSNSDLVQLRADIGTEVEALGCKMEPAAVHILLYVMKMVHETHQRLVTPSTLQYSKTLNLQKNCNKNRRVH